MLNTFYTFPLNMLLFTAIILSLAISFCSSLPASGIIVTGTTVSPGYNRDEGKGKPRFINKAGISIIIGIPEEGYPKSTSKAVHLLNFVNNFLKHLGYKNQIHWLRFEQPSSKQII